MIVFAVVILIFIALALTSILFVWYVVFKKSLRKMVFTMLGIVQERDRLVDPDAEIMPNQAKHASDSLEEKAEDFKSTAPIMPRHNPPVAHIPPYERGELASDTSDNGWPRELDDETRRERHPFREVHLQTENEIYEPPQDFVEKSDILDEENPIVEPTNQPIEAEIPDRNVPDLDVSDSEYGVRYSDNSPGRRLRDKRYRRNASD